MTWVPSRQLRNAARLTPVARLTAEMLWPERMAVNATQRTSASYMSAVWR
jgi:hypothetical protein